MDESEPQGQTFSRVLIALMKGILSRETDEERWQALIDRQSAVRDHVALLGLELRLDETEGYAWLATRTANDGEPELPRLIARRPLSYPVSLILALMRKKLVESDASGEGRLILSVDDVLEMIRLFLPETANEAKLADQIDAHLNKIVELGFARRLRGQDQKIEVRRILNSFVEAQWLVEFDRRLKAYRDHATEMSDSKGDPA
jgi:hypothetical protein